MIIFFHDKLVGYVTDFSFILINKQEVFLIRFDLFLILYWELTDQAGFRSVHRSAQQIHFLRWTLDDFHKFQYLPPPHSWLCRKQQQQQLALWP